MIDHNAATREATAAAEECHELARETGGRKFRLEGTPAGNSRLLYLATTFSLRARFGGRVVNYRPRPELPPLEQAAKDGELPPCPLCGAPAGWACRPRAWRLGRRRRRPHAVRQALTAGSGA